EAELRFDRRVTGWDQAVLPFGRARRADPEGFSAVGAELCDVAGRVERAADVEAVRGVGPGRGEVLPHPGPPLPLAVLIHPPPIRIPGRQPAEQAADQEHDLAGGG